MIIKLALRVLINSGAVYLADSLVSGFTFSGDFVILFIIGAILAAFQTFVYPIVKVLAFPLVLLSFGLFGFVVNAGVLWGISYFFDELTIDGFVPLILATIIITIVNIPFSWL